MKTVTFYNPKDMETQLEIFINSKDEISISITDGERPETIISLEKQDVKELIVDLLKLLKEVW